MLATLLLATLLAGAALGQAAPQLPAAEPATAPASADHPLAGHWEGEITLPAGTLQVMVDLAAGEDGWTGTIDIPAQGAKQLPLTDLAVGTDTARFSIAGVPGNPTFDGKLAEGELHGDFTQGGGQLTFRLGRQAVEVHKRPQEPSEPLPYRSEEVGYDHGDVHLAATLTLPPGDGPFPAVVMITGSGPQNRDEALLGHKPFLVISDHLTRAGIAVLRADDRGVGGSTGDVNSSTSSDFADDALAGVAYLKGRPEIDGSRIGLVGHSEGGLVGPLAAVRSSDVAFVVMLAGPGVPGDEVVLLQSERISRADGGDEEAIAAETREMKEAFALIAKGGDEAELRAALDAIAQRQLAQLSDQQRAALGDGAEAEIRRQIDRITTPWFRYFLTYDPAATLRQVKVPVLALNGALDLQVDADQNLPPIAAALKEAGNPDVTVQRLPGLNHLFQHAQTGSPTEYAEIEETFAPEALKIISDWILQRFGSGAQRTP
jgi:hypothetical protein